MSEEAHSYPAPDLTTPQFTVRAILTGVVLGGVLSLCNVYMGLKIGWGFNMSITAALLSYGFYEFASKSFGARRWNKLENNINQTAASSAASISSAGLVAPIPALTLLTLEMTGTGFEMSFLELFVWTFSVSLVGVAVAVGLRKQMLIVDKLTFPGGVAAGETLNEMYAKGSEALARVKMLLTGAFVGAAAHAGFHLAKVGSFAIPLQIKGISFSSLTMTLNPSPLFLAVGALVGVRAGLSMLLGAVVAWLVIAPIGIENEWILPSATGKYGFKESVTWLLWPGVAMMVTASLTSFGFSWRSIVNAIRGTNQAPDSTLPDADEVPRNVFMGFIAVSLVASVWLQFAIFGIGWGLATFGVLLTFVLAIVAARVSGETGITPVGPMGKVTQLTFGAIDPSNFQANLMAANVTGGAASQCADLLHDMKTGLMVGASPRLQTYSQFFGVLSGAVFGSLGYMVLVGDASQLKEMYDSAEWAMPAVMQWKSVAEIFSGGIENLPVNAGPAMLFAGVLGVLMAIAEKVLPGKIVGYFPSPTAVGLAFVIPGSYSISMALGGVLAWWLFKKKLAWSNRFLIVLAAGVIAGDSLTGVCLAMLKILGV